MPNKDELTPRQIVAHLDKYIVGQDKAKRAVAIALRNRLRRRRLPSGLAEEVQPKNILMIGATGVGKTEIARRLARLVGAPFIKVEATKYTEVGYVGRDVESMIRDLTDTAVRMVKDEKMAEVQDRAAALVEDRLLDLLLPGRKPSAGKHPLASLFGMQAEPEQSAPEDEASGTEQTATRRELQRRLAAGLLEDHLVDVEVEEAPPALDVFAGTGQDMLAGQMQDLLGQMLPRRKRRRRMTVAEARQVLLQEEAQKLIDMEQVAAEAVHRAEQSGIVFIDEIDKIVRKENSGGPDVSREGVQRDILPIIEGSTVMTKYGPVRTDHMLFIAAGAFHVSKPSELIPELQGRFPIRVELEPLTRHDFERILTEPENALTRQYQALLATEGVEVEFAPDGIAAIAELAAQVNESQENIGARRLHTILEKVLEELSFAAPEDAPPRVVIDRDYVVTRLADVAADADLSRYIL